jgi:hypothetical protein
VFATSRPLDLEPGQVSVSVAGGIIDPGTTELFPVEGSQVTFGAEVDPASSERLFVKLCIDPSHPAGVPPGKYVGTILISGPEISPTQIPITLTLKSAKWWLVWLLAFVGLAVGIGAKLLAQHINYDKALTRPHLIWIIGVGVVGSILVVKKLYYDPSTFGDSFSNFWPIAAGAFGAALGGAGVASLVKE